MEKKKTFQDTIKDFVESNKDKPDNGYALEDYELGRNPDSGSVCEYSINKNPFRWCKITFIGSNVVSLETETSPTITNTLDSVEFRPIHSAKREAIGNMMNSASVGMKGIDFANRLYEAGYRLQEEK